jgi:hypothetical protein
LWKYPRSYLIYTDSFGQLPEENVTRLGMRMQEVLSGKDEAETWNHLSPADRQAVMQILLGTREHLPEAFVTQLSDISPAAPAN